MIIKEVVELKYLSLGYDLFQNDISLFELMTPFVSNNINYTDEKTNNLPIYITNDYKIVLKIKNKHIDKNIRLIKNEIFKANVNFIPCNNKEINAYYIKLNNQSI